MSKEKRLGRGLEAMFGKVAAQLQESDEVIDPANPHNFSVVSCDPELDDSPATQVADMPYCEIPVDLIDPNPYQPRIDFEPAELESLALSIQEQGMIQPIAVRRNADRFELISGERRLRACKALDWPTIPACIREKDDREMAELALTENMQRKDLNAIEKAVAFRNYIEAYGGTHEELAKRLGFERSTVTNLMRLLDLPVELQTAVRENQLTQGHARALITLEDWEQLEVAQRIIDEGWSVRQTETFVQDLLNGPTTSAVEKTSPVEKAKEENLQLRELEQQFHNALGMKVKLTSNAKGKGKLVIPFSSNDEFERIYRLICPKKS